MPKNLDTYNRVRKNNVCLATNRLSFIKPRIDVKNFYDTILRNDGIGIITRREKTNPSFPNTKYALSIDQLHNTSTLFNFSSERIVNDRFHNHYKSAIKPQLMLHRDETNEDFPAILGLKTLKHDFHFTKDAEIALVDIVKNILTISNTTFLYSLSAGSEISGSGETGVGSLSGVGDTGVMEIGYFKRGMVYPPSDTDYPAERFVSSKNNPCEYRLSPNNHVRDYSTYVPTVVDESSSISLTISTGDQFSIKTIKSDIIVPFDPEGEKEYDKIEELLSEIDIGKGKFFTNDDITTQEEIDTDQKAEDITNHTYFAYTTRYYPFHHNEFSYAVYINNSKYNYDNGQFALIKKKAEGQKLNSTIQHTYSTTLTFNTTTLASIIGIGISGCSVNTTGIISFTTTPISGTSNTEVDITKMDYYAITSTKTKDTREKYISPLKYYTNKGDTTVNYNNVVPNTVNKSIIDTRTTTVYSTHLNTSLEGETAYKDTCAEIMAIGGGDIAKEHYELLSTLDDAQVFLTDFNSFTDRFEPSGVKTLALTGKNFTKFNPFPDKVEFITSKTTRPLDDRYISDFKQRTINTLYSNNFYLLSATFRYDMYYNHKQSYQNKSVLIGQGTVQGFSDLSNAPNYFLHDMPLNRSMVTQLINSDYFTPEEIILATKDNNIDLKTLFTGEVVAIVYNNNIHNYILKSADHRLQTQYIGTKDTKIIDDDKRTPKTPPNYNNPDDPVKLKIHKVITEWGEYTDKQRKEFQIIPREVITISGGF